MKEYDLRAYGSGRENIIQGQYIIHKMNQSFLNQWNDITNQ